MMATSPLPEELWVLLSQAFYGFLTELDVQPREPMHNQSNQLYDFLFKGRHYIVKEFLNRNEFRSSPLREYKGLQLLMSKGIAPRPVYFNPGSEETNRPVVVYEFLDGLMWNRKKPSADNLKQLSDLYTTINAVQHHAPWPSRSNEYPYRAVDRLVQTIADYSEYCQEEYTQALPILSQIEELFEKRKLDLDTLRKIPPQNCFSRGDPRFANVLNKTDGSLAMVDWEDCGWLDPALDIADLITHPNQEDLLSGAEWRPFLEPYIQSREAAGDRTFQERLELYTGVLTLFTLIRLIQLGLNLRNIEGFEDWEINELPASQRLGRYLGRSIIWPEMDLVEPEIPAGELSFFKQL